MLLPTIELHHDDFIEIVHEFTNDLVDRVQNKNQVILLHCFGGHGRTGKSDLF